MTTSPEEPAKVTSVVQKTSNRPRRRGIYLLPNLFTTAALFTGFYAIVAATQDKFAIAATAVFIGMILDALDGRVARMTNTQSDFGKEYDSLSDMIVFGVTPAVVMYEWGLFSLYEYSDSIGKIGWLGAFLYTACAALRLARFNTIAGSDNEDKRYFTGLSSPAAAAVVLGFIWFLADLGYAGEYFAIPGLILTVMAAILMVSNVKYRSFKELNLARKVPFLVMVGMALAVAIVAFNPPPVLFFGALAYALSGPVGAVLRRRERRAKANAAVDKE